MYFIILFINKTFQHHELSFPPIKLSFQKVPRFAIEAKFSFILFRIFKQTQVPVQECTDVPKGPGR